LPSILKALGSISSTTKKKKKKEIERKRKEICSFIYCQIKNVILGVGRRKGEVAQTMQQIKKRKKNVILARSQWLTPVIPATQEAEIRRIKV
jgi:lipoate synthase